MNLLVMDMSDKAFPGSGPVRGQSAMNFDSDHSSDLYNTRTQLDASGVIGAFHTLP